MPPSGHSFMIYTISIDLGNTNMPKTDIAKLFQNGRSQAVRLPREFRFEGDRVRIRRVGQGVLLEPIIQDAKGMVSEARMSLIPNHLCPKAANSRSSKAAHTRVDRGLPPRYQRVYRFCIKNTDSLVRGRFQRGFAFGRHRICSMRLLPSIVVRSRE